MKYDELNLYYLPKTKSRSFSAFGRGTGGFPINRLLQLPQVINSKEINATPDFMVMNKFSN